MKPTFIKLLKEKKKKKRESILDKIVESGLLC